jgi:hypothetical protein
MLLPRSFLAIQKLGLIHTDGILQRFTGCAEPSDEAISEYAARS